MDEELLALLGLDADASDDEIIEAVTALKTRAEDLQASLNGRDQEIAALKREGAPDPAKYVPASVVEELKTEIAALRTDHTTREVAELVEVALSEGKLLPAQETWARELGQTDIAALKSYLENTPAIAALSGSQTGGEGPAEGDGELTAAQLAICKATGTDPEDYKKTLTAA